MRSLKFAHQMLILISVPLMFQLASTVVLTVALSNLESIYKSEARSRDAMVLLNKFLLSMIMGFGDQATFVATRELRPRGTATQLHASIQAEAEAQRQAFKQFVREDKEGGKQWQFVDEIFEALRQTLSRSAQAVSTRDDIDAVIAIRDASRLMRKVTAVSTTAMKALDQEQFSKRQIHTREMNQLRFMLYGALGANFVLAVGLMAVFAQVTSKRFAALSRNISLLGMNRPLLPTLSGDDDIAQLDRVLHNVSEALEEARQKEQAIIENAEDIICSISPLLRFGRVNPAAEKVLGYPQDELIEKTVMSLIHDDDKDCTAEKLQSIMNSAGSGSFETRMISRGGTVVDTLWNVRSSDEKDLFCVVHDISERKQAERIKKEVVAVVSHDLRSPLTALQLTLDVLQSGATDDKAKDRLRRASISVGQLVNLTNDLLEMDKLESGVFILNKGSRPAREIIDSAVLLVEDNATSSNINLVAQASDELVECDGDRISRVLVNLISNAVKFSPSPSTVKITAQSSNGHMRFEVKDEGRGIAPEKLSSIFDRYKQLDREDEANRRGAGLGLAIAKAIVEAHDGKIGVESQPGKGSVFWFEIPQATSKS